MISIDIRYHISAAGLALLALVAGCSRGGKAESRPEDAEPSRGLALFVASGGDDGNPGTAAKPFATLERARDEIRALRAKGAGAQPQEPVTVLLRGGRYEVARPFELTAQDSGSAGAPIVYRTRKGEEARIVGGRAVTGWQVVSDGAVLERLDPAARGKVMQADLRALGVTDFGQMGGGFGLGGGPGLELFFQDKPMTLARYPNEGFIRISAVLGATERDVRGTKGRLEGIFSYDDDRPRRWIGEKDPWVLGYWFYDWAEQRHRIESIDAEQKVMTLAKPFHGYGYRKGQWFYGFNLLCEIDQPGEWYLDREAGRLYFWPPAEIGQGKPTVSVLPHLVTMTGVAHVALRGLTFEATRNDAIIMKGCTNSVVAGCTIRNVGSWAVRVSDGKDSGVVGCDIYATADGGIGLSGGALKTLEPAGLYAENNHIHHWSRWNRMYRPAISLSGVGNRASRNLLENAPHTAIGFGGNDHVIEFNEIHSVCHESNDAGAIYSGRNWTMRGTVVRCNYLHHINGFEGRGCVGVYLDDMFCGTAIASNVFYKVTRAAFIGGGHDNTIENNIFVDCKPAVHVDARGMGWAHAMPEGLIKEGGEKGTLNGIHFKEPPYSTRYPKLIGILDKDPASPTGTLVARNICSGGKWDEIDKKAQPFVTLENNLLDGDPKFVDREKLDFRLRDDSPAFKLGFRPIPIEKIGLYQSADRATWPVSHSVRPMVEPPPKAGQAK
ncbi:MAG TPA: right-handed parallel beta-helix repeat-containing protein [Verrucomicrobiae bacterium]|nr:right-handed parallel beta-helix repeat-containing protein [Verrucomicrobiae bacterium]